MSNAEQKTDLLDDLITKAKKAGADACDALLVNGISLSHARRLGNLEHIQRSEGADLGLRVFIGKRQAMASSSDTSREALDELVERAIGMANSVPEDTYCGLAPAELLASEIPDIDINDKTEPSTEKLMKMAAGAEDAAMTVSGVTNSEGAEASWGRSMVFIASSNGFAQNYSTSRHSLSASVLAGEGTDMERDYDYSTTVYGEDLRPAEDIGRLAGERAVKRLNSRKVKTAQVPVIYDTRVCASILQHLSMAINGASVARGTSFLKDRMGEKIFPDNITIIDDALRKRGLRSKPFDGECVATRQRNVIENGVLSSWTLDLRSARQLQMNTTGNASRGTSSPPSPAVTNMYIKPGKATPKEMISDIKSGLYITELIGFGINAVTGDYSRGASGFWIEKGEITYPVSGITVAGNLNSMFLQLSAANDLEFRYGIDAPTLRIDGLTVAGT